MKDNSFNAAGGPPEDKGNFVYMVALFNGIAVLLPWNAILSNLDFMNFRMPDYQPAANFPFAVNSLQLVAMILVQLYTSTWSYNFKLGVMYLIISVLTIILPFVAEFEHKNEGTDFTLCVIILFCFGIGVAFTQASGFAFTGVLPGKYIGIFMVG